LNGTFFGSSGTSGTSGSAGTSGLTSSSGTSGTSGTSGVNGTFFGSSGTSGANGSTGEAGSSGTSGTNAPGFSSGTSGISGTSGTSAVGFSSGTSGTSGFPISGTTNNGVVTYVNAPTGVQVEDNLTFDGSTLTITGTTTQTGNIDVTGAISATQNITATTFRETFNDLGTGGSVTIDLSTANNFRRQFNSTPTITFTNPPASNAFGFTLVTVNAGSYTPVWPVNIDWVNGPNAPVLTGSGGVDVLVFYTFNGGTTYYGFVGGKNFN
jgi:hypothetical protein